MLVVFGIFALILIVGIILSAISLLLAVTGVTVQTFLPKPKSGDGSSRAIDLLNRALDWGYILMMTGFAGLFFYVTANSGKGSAWLWAVGVVLAFIPIVMSIRIIRRLD